MSNFTEEQSELLIDLVRQYPVLYNLQHKNYFNSTIKENAWKIISETLKKPVGECKTRWKTIRDSYRKQSKKLGSGSAANSRSKYSNEKLQFLDTVAFQRGSKTNIVNVPETQSEQNDEVTQDIQEVEAVCTDYTNLNISNSATDVDTNSEFSSASQLTQSKRKRNDMLVEEIKRSRIQREELINKFVEKKERNPVDIFFESIAATVKTFPPELIIGTKLSVTKLISEFELRALSQSCATLQYNTNTDGDVTYTDL